MTDAKVATLYENYRDSGTIQNLPKKVEGLKKRSTMLGAGVSLAVFAANEVARFTLRSPLFRIKPVPCFLVLVGPTALLKYGAKDEIEKEVNELWRIHRVREEKGMEGTYRSDGLYPNMIHDNQLMSKYPREYNLEELLLGRKVDMLVPTPMTRFNKTFEEYPDFHEDYDRDKLSSQLDNLERLKPFDPVEGTTKMNWYAHPLEDTDQKAMWGGPEGDTPFAEPPDPELGPAMDHRQDERQIWAFNLTGYNQVLVNNKWVLDPVKAATDSNAPFWMGKMMSPCFYSKEKLKEFYEQMAVRKEFDLLKFKFAQQAKVNGSIGLQRQQKEEALNFLEEAYKEKTLRDMEEVHVTDRTPRPKRLHTNNEEEDRDFYNYEQKLKEFHSDTTTKATHRQLRIDEHPFDRLGKPLANAVRNEDGSYTLEVKDTDLPLDNKTLKERFEYYQQAAEVVSEPVEEEEEDDEEGPSFEEMVSEDDTGYYKGLFEYIGRRRSIDSIDTLVDRLDNFTEEEYSAVKDYQDAYRKSLSTPLAEQIFDQIPDHAFYDIKTPLKKPANIKVNPFNPVKPVTANSFFELRTNEDFFYRRKRKPNLKESISSFKDQ